jgi:hypothetical protein
VNYSYVSVYIIVSNFSKFFVRIRRFYRFYFRDLSYRYIDYTAPIIYFYFSISRLTDSSIWIISSILFLSCPPIRIKKFPLKKYIIKNRERERINPSNFKINKISKTRLIKFNAINYCILRDWIFTCKTEYANSCNKRNTFPVPPFRLINYEKKRIDPAISNRIT